jgi:hypothetical protein
MNDVELVQHLVDSLDTGLPERPDLKPVRSAGTRQRRRRRVGWTAGLCAAAGALVVPAALLAGSGSSPTVAPDVAADPAPAVAPAPAPPPVSPDELAGPEFGVAMRAAVEQAVPTATFQSEALGDGWQFDDEREVYDWTVGDPVHWDTLFVWDQLFRLPGGAHLDVVVGRTSPDGVMGGGGPTQCNQPHYPSRLGCEATDFGEQLVLVNDGIQYEDNGRWYRDVDVSYFDQTRGMDAHVTLSAFADAPTWAQARELLPSAAELTALGRQPALVLPAPDHYPTPDDLDEHGSSKP